MLQEALKSRRAAAGKAGPNTSTLLNSTATGGASSTSTAGQKNNKRYLILTYVAEFDRCVVADLQRPCLCSSAAAHPSPSALLLSFSLQRALPATSHL